MKDKFKTLLKKEREFVESKGFDVSKMTDNEVDLLFEKLVKEIYNEENRLQKN